jgi:hypothetical protein
MIVTVNSAKDRIPFYPGFNTHTHTHTHTHTALDTKTDAKVHFFI